jgi:hypothetical protein
MQIPIPLSYKHDFDPCDTPGTGATYPRMSRWNYAADISDYIAVCRDAYGIMTQCTALHPTGEPLTGIDAFRALMVHELVHREQVIKLAGLLPNSTGWWKMGWSFEEIPVNHWNLGSDDQPGIASYDDDHDGAIDNYRATPNDNKDFELGHGFVGIIGVDELLDRKQLATRIMDGIAIQDPVNTKEEEWELRDWPKAWPKPSGCLPGSCCDNMFDWDASISQPQNDDDPALVMGDWANPGKQHRSMDYRD